MFSLTPGENLIKFHIVKKKETKQNKTKTKTKKQKHEYKLHKDHFTTSLEWM